MTLAEGIRDRSFAASRKLQPACDLHHHGRQRALLLQCGGNFRTTFEVQQLVVCDDACNGFEFETIILVDERKVKGADVRRVPVRPADGGEQCGGG